MADRCPGLPAKVQNFETVAALIELEVLSTQQGGERFVKKTVNLELSRVHVGCSHLFEEVVIKFKSLRFSCCNDKNKSLTALENIPNKYSEQNKHMHPNAFLSIDGN